jgi:pimeloyl-ACP methyl ester carboxylesterase
MNPELQKIRAALLAVVTAGMAGAQRAPARTPASQTLAARTAAPVRTRNVVLVHGAWADGSSWEKVIPILQAAGLHVTAVQNPLTSLADADAETRRVLAQQDGPTVLAGYSWSGTVVSDTGNDRRVSALVYVAARAPDAGEDFVAFRQVPYHAGTRRSRDA